MRTIAVNIYTFDELKANAQMQAVNKMINLWMEYPSMIPTKKATDKFKELFDKAERLRTPWFLGEMIYEEQLNDVIECCKWFEYYSDGLPYQAIEEEKKNDN